MKFDEAAYHRYLELFNKPDHDTLYAEFFAPDVELVTLGNVLKGHEGIRKFYAYFHTRVKEDIDLIKFYPTDSGAWVHVKMRITVFGDVTEEGLRAVGIEGMPALPKDTVYENEMFIHYQQGADGKLRLLRCAEYIPPR